MNRQALIMSEINPGNYIEFFNNSSSPLQLTGSPYELCSPFAYASLTDVGAGITIPARGYATVPWPTAFGLDNDTAGEVILYLDANFGSATSIMDFVCWGTQRGQTRKSTAEAGMKWSGDCAGSLVGGAIHRKPQTMGTIAADYDVTTAAAATNCGP